MKPGTFTQLYIHLIFAVQNRKALINETIQHNVFSYLSGILTQRDHKSIIVNGTEDHVHLLIGLNPKESVSTLVHELKRCTTLYINQEKLCNFHFTWQEGYGAFSYSKSQLDVVYNYIANQKEHHQKKTFKDEYIQFLKKLNIEYDEKYLFMFHTDV